MIEDRKRSRFLLGCLRSGLGVQRVKEEVERVYHGGTRQQTASEGGGDANKVSVHSARVWNDQVDKPNRTGICHDVGSDQRCKT